MAANLLPNHHAWRTLALAGITALLGACAGLQATPLTPGQELPPIVAAHPGVPGMDAAKLTPGYWIARLATPDALMLDPAHIAAQNARLARVDAHVADLAALPASLDRETVRQHILALSSPPARPLYGLDGRSLEAEVLEQLQDALALDTIAEQVTPRFALAVRRADLRAFPTTRRVFSRPGDTDIDRFQESALFPGNPVAILHQSRDGQWSFVVSRFYSAWVETRHLAAGERADVLDYATRMPALVVTGASARTVFTPEAPAVSDVALDMGVRLPLIADWPSGQPVNGQFTYASHVVAMPVRGGDGWLDIIPALVPRSADVREGYLPLTRAGLISQAFKFLGERYGWGHAYGTRDCSGFVSEVYRSFGVELPRNTSAQAVTTAFDRIAFSPDDSHAQRVAVLRTLDTGDLIYIPGHVMMVLGQEDGDVWLIHDTTGIRYRGPDRQLVSVPLNQVAVTPLLPLLGESGTPFVDFITAIQRIRATDSE